MTDKKYDKLTKQERIRLFYYFVTGVLQVKDAPDWMIVETIKEEMDKIENMEE